MPKNLTDCAHFLALKNGQNAPSQALTPEAIRTQVVPSGPLTLSYAGYLLPDTALSQLQALAVEQDVVGTYLNLLNGEPINVTEDRPVHHHHTRATDRRHYGLEQARFSSFAVAVRQGDYLTGGNTRFTHVVQVGIGGSQLGPQALIEGLAQWANAQNRHTLTVNFLANMDSDECLLVLSQIPLEHTLFIVASKSGTTSEPLTNFAIIRSRYLALGWRDDQIKRHFIAVTMAGCALATSADIHTAFYIDEAIGGRYSGTSAIGGVVLSLAYGPDTFEELLQGAHAMDVSAQTPDCHTNMSLMAALLSLWDRHIVGCATKAIIPYSYVLRSWTAHIQQLWCESNGKRVNVAGEAISYPTGAIIFGEPGTNAQHSFFQLIHQGSDPYAIQLIGISNSNDQLLANVVAQLVAFSVGEKKGPLFHQCPGGRTCSLVMMPDVSPYTLGALLAFYENTVMFESFLYHINAFDQEGVQLGKTLAQDALSGSGETARLLHTYMSIIRSAGA